MNENTQTYSYKEFLLKTDYYKQLLKEIQCYDIDEVAKDLGLVYEIIYALNTIEKFKDSEEIRDTVTPLYDGFNVYVETLKGKVNLTKLTKVKKHNKLLKAKYEGENYDGIYEKEKIIQLGTFSDMGLIKDILGRLSPLIIIAAGYFLMKAGVILRIVEMLLNMLE